MKIMKHFIIIICLCFGSVQSTIAQNILSADQQEQVTENVSDFIYNLNLSERDKPAFKEIIKQVFYKIRILKQ